MEIIVKTLLGLENLLEEELISLGLENTNKGNRMVSGEGSAAILYKLNLASALALKILVPIGKFTVRNKDDLYRKTKNLPWGDWLSPNTSFAIDPIVYSDAFPHSAYPALVAKDAICDKLREETGTRPNVNTTTPDFKINLHISGKSCTVSLDSSGESLHKRGWRPHGHEAPLNEVLAAGLVRYTGWDKETPFYDLFCGTGTLLTEAAVYACNYPANLRREQFLFMNWPDFDARLFSLIKDDLVKKISPQKVIIKGSDISAKALDLAIKCVRYADLPCQIEVTRKDFFKYLPETDKGLIISNLPYGIRLSIEDMQEFHKKIGDKLKTDLAGFEAWFLSSEKDYLKRIGLKPSKKMLFNNGGLDVWLFQFRVFKGKLAAHKYDTDEASENTHISET